MKAFLQALSFLAILPAGRNIPMDGKTLARSMAFFPVAGLLIGLILALAYSVLIWLLPKSLALWSTVGLLALVTGGLHLDGFADTIDGLACGGTRERVLEVMRDSRIGALGVIGLIFLIGAKFFALDQIPDPVIPYSIISMIVMGRSSMVLVCYRSPYPRSGEGLAKPFVENLTAREVILSSVSALGIALLAMNVKGILVFSGVALFSLGYRAFFIRKLGGITGDILGASNELAELLSLSLLIVLERF
ncbi:MAG: adenosylcobinamide-GDP ribazoletransferase [Thermodesulfobacteriota bacterium]